MSGQMIVAVLLAWVSGALTSAAFFYPLGRRHGIEALAARLKGVRREEIVAELARAAGARVRGDLTTPH